MPFHVIISLIFRQACHCPPIKHHICFYFIKKSRFPQIFINSICLLFTILVESPRYIQLLVCQDDNPPPPPFVCCRHERVMFQNTKVVMWLSKILPSSHGHNCRGRSIEVLLHLIWIAEDWRSSGHARCIRLSYLLHAWLCKRKVAHFLTLNNSLFIWWKKIDI